METTVQKIERLKREQNPWEELPRLFTALRSGIGAVPAADLNQRLRWWGVYTQGDGQGAFGGAAPYFMLRIRIPNGLLAAPQVRAIAALSRRYGRGLADVTVRQNLQLHWLDAEALPDVFHALWRVGLTSQAACGDDPRTTTGCPLAGLDPEEYVDASPLARAVDAAVLAGADFYNLPRKFKLCVTGCRHWCPNPEINDAAFTAYPPGFFAEPGRYFGLRVGGGLSTTPHLAQALPVAVAAEQVPAVARALVALFRDRDELRQNRGRARLKFLFLQHGWTVERFRQELESRLGYRLRDAEPDPAPAPAFRDHIGIHRQRDPLHGGALYYAGISVLRGRISAAQLDTVAEAAARWGSGDVRATAMQNLVIAGIPEAHVPALVDHLAQAGLPVEASNFRRGVMSCTGKEFCKLAVTETKTFAAELVTALERRLPGFALPLRINLNGCPNSCGQHWIADIGLQGTRVKTAAGPEDGFDVYLGGGLGAGARLAQRTLGRVRGSELPDRLESLLRYFLAARRDGESFQHFVEHQGTARLEAVLGTLPQAEVLVKLREAGDAPAAAGA